MSSNYADTIKDAHQSVENLTKALIGLEQEFYDKRRAGGGGVEYTYWPKSDEPEIRAIEVIGFVLAELDPTQQERVLRYAAERWKPQPQEPRP